MKRQKEFDYAKTMAFFFMVIIHVFEELSSYGIADALPSGFPENLIQFAAGPYAAPLFILSMGVGTVFSSRQEPGQMVRRGVKLIIVALALNIARGIIPNLTACLVLGNPPDWELLRYLMFNIDVLHFAGLALILTALFKKFRVPVYALIPIAAVMQALGNWLSQILNAKGILEIPLSYFIYTDSLSCFPLMNWYICLASGIVIGTVIKHFSGKLDKFYTGCLWCSLCLLAGFMGACHINAIDGRSFYALYEDLLYRQTFFNFIYNTLVIMILLSVIHIVIKYVPKGYGFFRYCSTNLTTIYLIQWVMIGWIIFSGNFVAIEPGFAGSVGMGILIACISIGISKLLPPIKW